MKSGGGNGRKHFDIALQGLMCFESMTGTLSMILTFSSHSNYCCWSCSRAVVHTANLATSTAFYNMSDVALGGNRDLVKNLEVHHLKHSLEWNLIKKYLKITNLHWDEIDNLMIGVSEPEKSLALGSELVIDIEEYQCNWGDEVCFYDYFHRSENWRLRWQ